MLEMGAAMIRVTTPHMVATQTPAPMNMIAAAMVVV
jgi:hypothetical protein